VLAVTTDRVVTSYAVIVYSVNVKKPIRPGPKNARVPVAIQSSRQPLTSPANPKSKELVAVCGGNIPRRAHLPPVDKKVRGVVGCPDDVLTIRADSNYLSDKL